MFNGTPLPPWAPPAATDSGEAEEAESGGAELTGTETGEGTEGRTGSIVVEDRVRLAVGRGETASETAIEGSGQVAAVMRVVEVPVGDGPEAAEIERDDEVVSVRIEALPATGKDAIPASLEVVKFEKAILFAVL